MDRAASSWLELANAILHDSTNSQSVVDRDALRALTRRRPRSQADRGHLEWADGSEGACRRLTMSMRGGAMLSVTLAAVGLLHLAPSSGEAQRSPCRRERDCAPGEVCGYAIAAGCEARGECIPRMPRPGSPACRVLAPLCGCNGTEQRVGCNYYDGYAPAPVAHAGACDRDAGTPDVSCRAWGGSCTGTAQCCNGLRCSPSGQPTALPGACVPN
jgi:hypothetical protein